MQYRIIPVTPFEQNCTLLWCEETGQAAVVDLRAVIFHAFSGLLKKVVSR